MPADTTYSLTDLARLASVTPRTVRYYIGQGLLPSPGSGPTARYGDNHLDRLLLIRKLQREHLPLAEIRRRLDELSDAQIGELNEPHVARETAAAYGPGAAAEYIRQVLGPNQHGAAIPALAAPTNITSTDPPMPGPAPDATSATDRSTWERVVLGPDVELHIRRPLDRFANKQIERLIRIGKELLADET